MSIYIYIYIYILYENLEYVVSFAVFADVKQISKKHLMNKIESFKIIFHLLSAGACMR